jgi:hypothetical protein
MRLNLFGSHVSNPVQIRNGQVASEPRRRERNLLEPETGLGGSRRQWRQNLTARQGACH